MFGFTMRVEKENFGVTLRAPSKSDIPTWTSGFSSMKVHMWTGQNFSQPLENEEEWYEKNRKAQDTCTWCIVPDGSEIPVGVTSLNKIDVYGTCSSGIIIWDPSWWRKGIATRAHLARTLYAADFLARFTIKSQVRCENPASFKALEKVGYSICGVEPRTSFRNGRWIDTYYLVWINPEKISFLFPEGLPEDYKKGVDRAQESLELARQVVQLV